MPYLLFVIIFILLAAGVIRCIQIVPQENAFILETLGKYQATWEAGLHIKLPFVQRVARRCSTKEQVADFEPQPVITHDNVTMLIDTVVFFKIFDPKLFTYGVERPLAAIENLTATTLRNVIGSLSLDETLVSREVINSRMQETLDTSTDPWGIKITRVEIKNIQPPRSIQDSMEKQMKAEREKRALILDAEGKKQSAITIAEGEKEAAILKADAVREKMIREADGEAQALYKIQEARAKAIELINNADPSEKYLQLRSMEAAEKMADGKASKLIVPSDFSNLAGLLSAAKESIKAEK